MLNIYNLGIPVVKGYTCSFHRTFVVIMQAAKLHFYVISFLKLAGKAANINVDMLSRSKQENAAVSAGLEHVDHDALW